MSSTELWSGKLTPTNQTLEEFLEANKDNLTYSYPDPVEEPYACFCENFWETHLLLGNMVFRIDATCEQKVFRLAKMVPLPDGSYDITMMFYNGGTGLSEMCNNAYQDLQND